METTQLIQKIERLRAALGEAEDADLSKWKAALEPVPELPGVVRLRHDFSGGLSKPQIENIVWTVTRSIADMYDHLRKWASAHGHEKEAVDRAVAGCFELALVIDLATYDKHGGHDRKGGRSKALSRLQNVSRRAMVSATYKAPGQVVGMAIGLDGVEPVGADRAAIVATGEIVLRDGRVLDLEYVQQKAVTAWEELFSFSAFMHSHCSD